MRLHVPAAPFLIAFILGPLLEDNFRQAMLMSGSDPMILVRGPITWFFWSLTIFTLLAITRGVIRKNKASVIKD
jgi:putative tricarboxylic transport membrane protein